MLLFYLRTAPASPIVSHMEAEFMTDALTDLTDCEAELAAFYAESDALAVATARPVAPYVAQVPPGFVPTFIRYREIMEADLGFLAIVATDLFAWRVGGPTVAQLHQTGTAVRVALDQTAAARNRRHREYKDGLRTRPMRTAV